MYRFTSFVLHLCNPMILLADSEGPDQTVRMHRLIWAFAVYICPKTHFPMPQPKYIKVTPVIACAKSIFK